MTEKLYQTDSYLKEFEAKIMEVNPEEHAIILDKTAFYPGGGGQPYDKGWITIGNQTYALKRARATKEGFWHYLEGEEALPAKGETAQCKLDWDRRYKLMRTHSAMHVLCGTIFRDFGAQVTGGDMEVLKGRMDFEFESMTKDLVHVIEDAVNTEIAKDHDVRVNILPREEAFQIPDLIRTKINLLPKGIKEVRTIEIVGLDLQADGGTHVHNTREIGKIKVPNYKSKGRINKRIYVELEG